MPVYCYKRENGNIVELAMTIEEKAKKEFQHEGKTAIFLDDGTIGLRDIETEFKGTRTFPNNWPLHSDAMGVHPGQTREAYEESVKMGIPTQFDSDGRAVFTDAKHRKKYCEAFGFHDRNAGYSDPVPSGSGQTKHKELLWQKRAQIRMLQK